MTLHPPKPPRMTLELQQQPPANSNDNEWMYAAARELFGPDFVVDETTDATTLSRIAQRAAQLKHEPPQLRPAQLIADLLSLGPQTLPVIFRYLADHAFEVRRNDGGRICDIFDFQEWLEELAAEAKR